MTRKQNRKELFIQETYHFQEKQNYLRNKCHNALFGSGLNKTAIIFKSFIKSLKLI